MDDCVDALHALLERGRVAEVALDDLRLDAVRRAGRDVDGNREAAERATEQKRELTR